MGDHKFPYKWNLSDGYPAKGINYHGKKVFGTFVCGGGSSMGYKLAGYDHLGGVEIDSKVGGVYILNHKPKYFYLEDIREFNKRNDLPKELYDLDLLDGSPPCSSFSMAGNREKDWGKKKVFREGQSDQVLDDLVFEYCDTIIKLKPKVFLLENVKGIIQGNAKVYAKKIVSKMTKAGYRVQVFCLNAASMGVPQRRERVFFIGLKGCIDLPKLKLDFNEKNVLFGSIISKSIKHKEFSEYDKNVWGNRKPSDKDYGDVNLRLKGKPSSFNAKFIHSDRVCNTIASSSGSKLVCFEEPRYLNHEELKKAGSYPLDFDFKSIKPKYLIGMSVPPVMTAQIAHQIYLQWLSKITM